MDSLVSAVVANLFMRGQRWRQHQPAPVCRRGIYVDTTFHILGKGFTEDNLRHLNRARPTIKFTVEQENIPLP